MYRCLKHEFSDQTNDASDATQILIPRFKVSEIIAQLCSIFLKCYLFVIIQKILRKASETIHLRIRDANIELQSSAETDNVINRSSFPCSGQFRPWAIVVPRMMVESPYHIHIAISEYELRETPGIFGSRFVSYKLESDMQERKVVTSKVVAYQRVSVNRRFNDFIAFDNRLRQYLSSKVILPVLPPKELPHQSYDPDVSDRRLRYLTAWLNLICNHNDIQRFLGFGKFIFDQNMPDAWLKAASASDVLDDPEDQDSYFLNDDLENSGSASIVMTPSAETRHSEAAKNNAEGLLSLVSRYLINCFNQNFPT